MLRWQALASAFVVSLALSARAEPPKFESALAAEVAVPGGLTADEVAARTASSSFDVAARRAEMAAAAAEVDRAFAAYLPRVTVSARYTRLSSPPDSQAGNIVVAPGAPAGPIGPGTPLFNAPLEFPVLQNQYAFQANLTVPVSDYFLRVAPGHAAARHSESAARNAVAAARRAAKADAKLSYYRWARARLGVIVAQQAVELAQAHSSDAKLALEVGTASQADVLRAESETADSERLLEASRNLVRVTEEQLRVAMHDPSSASYQIGENVQTELPRVRTTPTEEAFARAVAKRPEAASLRQALLAQRKAASAERAGGWPRLDLFANAYYQNPNPRAFPQRDEFTTSWDFGAQVTWTLSDIPGSAAASGAARAKVDALAAKERALADQIRLEVVKAQSDVADADFAVKSSTTSLRAAEEGYRARRLAFQNGRASGVELLDAETNLTKARFASINARIDARIARVRLAYALGGVD